MGTDERQKVIQREQGRRLRAARLNMKLETAVKAAAHLKISPDTYSAHENGNRGINTRKAAKYAEAYGVTVDWLLDGKNPPEWASADAGSLEETGAEHFLMAWRLHRGLSLQDLADRLNVPVELVHSWESGAADISNKRLNQIAKVFETTAGSILDVDPANVAPNVLALWRDTAARQAETRERVAEGRKTSVQDVYAALGGSMPAPIEDKKRRA